jgi:tetratricopeptide (TPR) repeat protein
MRHAVLSVASSSRAVFELGSVCLLFCGLRATRVWVVRCDSPWKAERKALRGLGAAFQLQGKNKEALEYMMRVLEIVEAHKGEMVETTDTLGVIADIYTDLGDMEQAAVYYDRYLAMLNDE